MILRHKSRQISLLHVYHHGSMLLLSDIAYHLFPYPAMTSYLGLNSAVHVVLYMYYGLSALYPENPPEWKKFLTQFQIVQFAIDLVHATYGYIYHTYCIYEPISKQEINPKIRKLTMCPMVYAME
ncbi:ELOV5-like protein [Mya arenaria]|uniref:Elongation of very long chain fatty acids protein n=1 Tax=Mya arenaria TaxID=6604 RepID=A0ABY7DL93_MYAAR|nr:ELOV5-like protein [Mya arenaria]